MLHRQANDHTDVFINQRIECCLNNTINLRPLTPHIMPCYSLPTKWRSYRGHRFCDVTSPYVYDFILRIGDIVFQRQEPVTCTGLDGVASRVQAGCAAVA